MGITDFLPGRVRKMCALDKRIWNIEYTLSGSVRNILSEGETWHRPHDLMILKPNGSRGWEVPKDAQAPWRVVWFVFLPKPEWIPLLDLPEEYPRYCHIALAGRKGTDEIRHSLLQACEQRALPGGGFGLAMNSLERALLWLQLELRAFDNPLDLRVKAAMKFFAHQLSNPPSIPAVAAATGVSTSHLGMLFRESTGQPPHVWLERYRLQCARDLLLTTDLAIKHIAADCGFKDQRHFATRFKKLFHITPSSCRAADSEC